MSDSSNPVDPPFNTRTDAKGQNRGPADEAPPFAGAESASAIAGETIQPVGEALGDAPTETPVTQRSTGRSAFLIGAGILISRIVGLIRQRVFAHYFGTSAAGDAFSAAFRIPNFLQNVFGEGALSASFIPVYARLLARHDEEEASHVASAVLALLALVTSVIVLVGVLTAPYLVAATGFRGETYDLTVRLVKRFFLSYTAPVAWNLALIATLIFFGRRVPQFPLAEYTAWGSVVGSALQFGVQLPIVFKLVHRLRPVFDFANVQVRSVVTSFFPVFMSRGVVQISAFVDAILASFLPTGSVNALMYAQSLYTLPVSLFGMSVSAAELPAMSRAIGTPDAVAEVLRYRLDEGLRRIAFFIVPSSMAFLALGDVIAAVLYQTGKFTHTDANYVWAILAGSTIGLLASTLGRLYSSTYYALHDTRTPLTYAIVRVTLTTVLGYLCALPLPRLLGIDPKWGVAGLTASAGIAGWVEFSLLRHTLNRRIGRTGLSLPYVLKLWASALIAAGLGWTCKSWLSSLHPIPLAAVVLGSYGIIYFAASFALGVREARELIGRATRLFKLQK